MTRICYYHAGCSDGFGAAWAIRHWFGDTYEYRPLQYGTELDPAEHADAEVLFVDVTIKADNMRELRATAWEVTVLDHHISAIRELQPLMDAAFFGGVLDVERSGARIAWDWGAELMTPIRPTPPAPDLIAYIEDRDLWRKKRRGCDEVALALRSYPLDFAIWTELMFNVPIDELIMQGNHIRRYHESLVDQLAGRARLLNVAGHLVPAVNCPGAFASDVGGRLAENHPFAVCYFDTADKRIYSLRSTPEGLDVSRIAQQFGGGGHRNAAGFTRPHRSAVRRRRSPQRGRIHPPAARPGGAGMNTPRLIGLAGPAGSGKSTVAELLEQHGGYTVASFAEPMYRALSAIFGHEFMLAVRAGKEKPDDMLAGKSPRFLLQTLGTEWGRNTVDPHLWVWMAHRRWCNHADAHGDGARMVFADVRFGNEADMLRESGGQIWHILRQVGPVRDHVSESGVPFEAGDRLIENTGSLKQLERTIRDALDD